MSRREDEIYEANRRHYPKWWWEVSDEDDDMKVTKEFLLNRKELNALNEFVSKHTHSNLFFLDNEGASGIGQNTHVMCEKCQKTEDITDYESW